jgi:hypothetical protein
MPPPTSRYGRLLICLARPIILQRGKCIGLTRPPPPSPPLSCSLRHHLEASPCSTSGGANNIQRPTRQGVPTRPLPLPLAYPHPLPYYASPPPSRCSVRCPQPPYPCDMPQPAPARSSVRCPQPPYAPASPSQELCEVPSATICPSQELCEVPSATICPSQPQPGARATTGVS